MLLPLCSAASHGGFSTNSFPELWNRWDVFCVQGQTVGRTSVTWFTVAWLCCREWCKSMCKTSLGNVLLWQPWELHLWNHSLHVGQWDVLMLWRVQIAVFAVQSWSKNRHPKTTLVFQSSVCVLSLFQECYNIIRDFQKMLQISVSKVNCFHECLFHLSFSPLFLLKLMQLWISTVLEKIQSCYSYELPHVAPFVCCFSTASLKCLCSTHTDHKITFFNQRNSPSPLQMWPNIFLVPCSP